MGSRTAAYIPKISSGEGYTGLLDKGSVTPLISTRIETERENGSLACSICFTATCNYNSVHKELQYYKGRTLSQPFSEIEVDQSVDSPLANVSHG
jgi:hypothetical protein